MLETTVELKMPEWPQSPESVLKPMREASARAMSNTLIRHFREKNRKEPNAKGWKRSNYWSQVGDSVTSRVEGNAAVAEIRKEGVRLHWLGGTVHPKTGKALAIPAEESVKGIWPSEYSGKKGGVKTFLAWPKGKDFGFIAERGAKELHVLWWLKEETHHNPDETTLPETDTLAKAVQRACKSVLRALKGGAA